MTVDINVCPTNQIVLDASFLDGKNPDYPKKLYHGPSGLSLISEEDIANSINYLSPVRDIFERQVYILPEIEREITSYYNLINNQITFIKKKRKSNNRMF